MTISPEYRELQKQLHKNPNYGVASLQYAQAIIELANQIGAKSISDYGAGKCNLQKKMHELGKTDFEYFPYDPSFPEYGEPTQADLVCCIDVLEHVEPNYVNDVLQELARITTNIGFFTIHTGPAQKVLADGRNAHLIQEPTSWWLPKLCSYFEIAQLRTVAGGFFVMTTPRQDFNNTDT